MSKEEFLKIQTCVLKVNIHCDGCEHKVKKILKKIDGVYTTKIDAEQGKVTVSGNVEPSTIIKKLAKSGKHAEIWGAKPSDSNINQLSNLFKNMEFDNGKSKGQKGNFQPNPQQQLQQMKGFQDLKMPFNAPPGQYKKSVKFDIPDDEFNDDEDDDMSDDEFGDFDDEDDEFDDEEDDMDDDPHRPLTKMKPDSGNAPQGPNLMMMNPQLLDAMKKNGVLKAVGGGTPVPVSGGKKGGGNCGNTGGNQIQGGGGPIKNGGGDPKSINNGVGGPNVNHMNVNGGPKKGESQPMTNLPNELRAMGVGGGFGGSMGHMPMPKGSTPNIHGPSPGAMNGGGGGYFGAGPAPGNPYQNQMAAATMMNQQRAMGNERFQPMMYARPPPEVNYMPPYPTPYPHQDPYSYPHPYPHPQSQGEAYTNYFDDENTSSCNVM